jgi:sn-glycerol 3-phosphate transport system substrate-binding protein
MRIGGARRDVQPRAAPGTALAQAAARMRRAVRAGASRRRPGGPWPCATTDPATQEEKPMPRTLTRKTFLQRLALGLGGTLLAGAVHAQAAVEVQFYYPVAVGGAIAKIMDGFAEGFMKDNPGIKVSPIYAGTYQETIVKALTAHKSGTPPVTSVLLSTDMFTLIDEDAIVPFDSFAKTAEDKAWLGGFFKAFMLNSQTGGKTWGIPFQRSTMVMYWNKELFKEAGLDPNKPPTSWAELKDMAAKLTKKDAAGKVTQYGVQIPSSGFPYWLFQTLTTTNGAILANDTGTAVKFDDPKVIEALQFWVDLGKAGIHPPGVVEWGTTPKDFFEKKAAMIWTTTGNLTNIRNNAKFDFGVAMIPANQRGLAHRRRQLLHLQEVQPGAAGGGLQVHQVDHPARARRAVEHRHRLRGGVAGGLRHAGAEEVHGRVPAGAGGARPVAVLGGRVLHPRQPARDQGAERRPAGRAHWHQEPGAGDEDAQREADRILRAFK